MWLVVAAAGKPDEFDTLAMSRSLGDKLFHLHGVSGTPEVVKHKVPQYA